MIAWVKVIHIAGIMLWCAGLLALPSIYLRRNGLRGEPLHELHRFARSVFIHFTSPAAFIAIIAGTLAGSPSRAICWTARLLIRKFCSSD